MSSTSAEHTAWTQAGSNASAQATYTSVKKALADIIARRDVDVFLQGSYANATNIRADSDVDIVVMTRLSFGTSVERLSAAGRAQWDALTSATYTPDLLRTEVTAALTTYYGSQRVRPRNKCVTVLKSAGSVDADVVPSTEYRYLERPGSNLHAAHVVGVRITPLRGPLIVNFPKEHIANGATKNALCRERYKPTVRQLKRLRNRAVEEGPSPGWRRARLPA